MHFSSVPILVAFYYLESTTVLVVLYCHVKDIIEILYYHVDILIIYSETCVRQPTLRLTLVIDEER